MNEIKLYDEKVFLRAPEPEDIPAMYDWENDAEVWSMGNQPSLFSRKNIADFVNNYDADIYATKQLRFIVCERESGKSIGTVDLYDFDPVNRRAAIGILIDRGYRRQGYASDALSIIEGYCSDRLGLHQIWAIVASGNVPSRRLFENSGYNITGCLKSWVRYGSGYADAYLYQKLFP